MIICHSFSWVLHLKFNCYNIIDVLNRHSWNCEIVYFPLSASSKFVYSGDPFFGNKAFPPSTTHSKLSSNKVSNYVLG